VLDAASSIYQGSSDPEALLGRAAAWGRPPGCPVGPGRSARPPAGRRRPHRIDEATAGKWCGSA